MQFFYSYNQYCSVILLTHFLSLANAKLPMQSIFFLCPRKIWLTLSSELSQLVKRKVSIRMIECRISLKNILKDRPTNFVGLSSCRIYTSQPCVLAANCYLLVEASLTLPWGINKIHSFIQKKMNWTSLRGHACFHMAKPMQCLFILSIWCSFTFRNTLLPLSRSFSFSH